MSQEPDEPTETSRRNRKCEIEGQQSKKPDVWSGLTAYTAIDRVETFEVIIAFGLW